MTVSFMASSKKGEGFVNWLIQKNPLNLTLPGYKFCGPGNPLVQQLRDSVQPSNRLDSYCREHDIAYQNSKQDSVLAEADKKLFKSAKSLITSKGVNFRERAAALLVTSAMKAKLGLSGSGAKRRPKKNFRKVAPKRKRRQIKSQNQVGGFLPLLLTLLAGAASASTLARNVKNWSAPPSGGGRINTHSSNILPMRKKRAGGRRRRGKTSLGRGAILRNYSRC